MTKFKYNENEILEKALQHIEKTYNSHYVGENAIQYMDIVMNQSDSLPFFKYTSPKYILRYGKKKGFNDEDIYKAIHFLVLMLNHVENKRKNNETIPENNVDLEELCEDQ